MQNNNNNKNKSYWAWAHRNHTTHILEYIFINIGFGNLIYEKNMESKIEAATFNA